MGILIAYFLGILTAINSKYHNGSSDHTSTDSHHHQNLIDRPIPVICIPPTQSKEEQAENKKQRRRKTIKFRVEMGSALILFLYAGFTAVIAFYSIRSANAAKKAAKATQDAVIESQKGSHLEQRAWVTPSEMFPSSKGKPWQISIVFKNTGRTPAKKFTVALAGEPVPKGTKPTASESIAPGRGVIAPDGQFHSSLSAEAPYDWDKYDLIIHGRIDYDSIFENHHWTKFCYYFVPESTKNAKGNFAPCDTGNDMDTNEP